MQSLTAIQLEASLINSDPGNKSCSMSSLAHSAVAMGTPQAGCQKTELHRAAQAGAGKGVISHQFALIQRYLITQGNACPVT